MPDKRDIADADAARIDAALVGKSAAQTELEQAVAAALLHGASIRAVVQSSGLSANTVQKYGAAHGWPTEENRAGFNKVRGPADWFAAERKRRGSR